MQGAYSALPTGSKGVLEAKTTARRDFNLLNTKCATIIQSKYKPANRPYRLGGLAAGGGALVGTGAFDTVEAERTVTVETAGDADVFLGITPFPDSENADYVTALEDAGVVD